MYDQRLKVKAAHHFMWRHLHASMQAAQKPTSKLRFVTPDKESGIHTFWQEKECEQIYSRKPLTEKAVEIEITILVTRKEHARVRHDFDPTKLNTYRLRNQKPDQLAWC